MATLDEVFGIRTEPVLSYVDRETVDVPFRAALESDHHIVIYGSSKQGKTSLRQTYISDANCVIVRCSPRMQIEGIYASILRQSKIRIETFESITNETTGRLRAKLGFKAFIPWVANANSEIEAEAQRGRQTQLQTEFVGFDFGEAQSIGELLKEAGFKKLVVVENFHYLPVEVQQQIAFDLKTFHEINVRFVILGIWREANLLVTHNRDLQDRLIEIPVEPWEPADFDRLVAKGCRELSISIAPAIVDTFKESAYGNVGLFQEFLENLCRLAGIEQTQQSIVPINDVKLAEATLSVKLHSQRGQLLKCLQGIAAKCRIRADDSDPLLLPYYLVQVICQTPVAQLKEGIERTNLLQLLRNVHHRSNKETVRMSDLTNLLQGLPALQQDIQPPFLYYDSNSRRLRIVDTRQFFVLSKVDGEELAEEIPYPIPDEPESDAP